VLPHMMEKHLARKHRVSLKDLEARQRDAKTAPHQEPQEGICAASNERISESNADSADARSHGSDEYEPTTQSTESNKRTPESICPQCGEPKQQFIACAHCGYSYIANLGAVKRQKRPKEQKALSKVDLSDGELIQCSQCGARVRQDRLEQHLKNAHMAEPKEYSQKTASDKAGAIASKPVRKSQAARARNRPQRPPPDILCPLCGQKVAQGTLRAHKRSVHGEAPAESKTSKTSKAPKKKVARTWTTIVSGGLPSLGKNRH